MAHEWGHTVQYGMSARGRRNPSPGRVTYMQPYYDITHDGRGGVARRAPIPAVSQYGATFGGRRGMGSLADSRAKERWAEAFTDHRPVSTRPPRATSGTASRSPSALRPDRVAMNVVVPICAGCRDLTDDWVCEAFPGGIPDPIVANEADHRAPYPADHGVRFAPVASWASEQGRERVRAGRHRGGRRRPLLRGMEGHGSRGVGREAR